MYLAFIDSATMLDVPEQVTSRRTAYGRGVLRILTRSLLGALVIVVLVLGGTAFRVWQVARLDQRTQVDVAIVLGAAQYDGQPSDVFKARLQHAKTLYVSGVVNYVLTVGGKQPGDVYTEAEAGQDWLVANGVPKDRVIAVGTGSDTLISLESVAPVYRQHGWDSAVIVSDPWHSLRAQMMARDAGINANVSPTHTGPVVQSREIQLKYIIRETGGVLFYRLFRAPAGDIGFNID